MKLPANSIKKIAIFRALQLGDMLCAIPAMRALRNAYPEAEITLLGLPWSRSLLQRFPEYFDHFMHFPCFPGLPEQKMDTQAFAVFLYQVLEQKFDLVLQLHGSGSIVNPMVELFGAKHTAGFYLPGDYCPDENLYLQYPDFIHECERHVQLMRHLGIDSCGVELEFPLYAKDYEEIHTSGLELSPGQYVCVHPGSRGVHRQWPPEYFAALADYCAEQNLDVVLTGTREELPIVEEVMKNMEYAALNAAGKTSIGGVGVLIDNAFALISNCTGVSHIAAACKTPSIVISMDGEPQRWGPLNKKLHHTIDWTQTTEFNVALTTLKQLFVRDLQGDHFKNDAIIARDDVGKHDPIF